MEHHEFRIDAPFWTASGEWLCTDVGTRVIVAVKVPPGGLSPGPPFADEVEIVFDEYDFEGCYPSAADRAEDMADDETGP